MHLGKSKEASVTGTKGRVVEDKRSHTQLIMSVGPCCRFMKAALKILAFAK